GPRAGTTASSGPAARTGGGAAGGHRGGGGTPRRGDLPADEWQAQATEVDPERPAGIDRVAQLPRAMHEPGEVAAGGPVAQRKLHLEDAQTGPRCVDRHPHLAAEPGGNGEAFGARGRRERALAGE